MATLKLYVDYKWINSSVSKIITVNEKRIISGARVNSQLMCNSTNNTY